MSRDNANSVSNKACLHSFRHTPTKVFTSRFTDDFLTSPYCLTLMHCKLDTQLVTSSKLHSENIMHLHTLWYSNHTV